MTKLNLGCGVSCQPDFIGIDINPGVNPTVVMDLETESLVDKFGENSVDEIFSSHFLEHVTNLIPILTDMWRVSKPGAIWDIHVPPADCEIGNPFHHFRFTEWTFRFFDPTNRFVHQPTGLLIAYGVTDGNCPVCLKEIEQSRTVADMRFLLEVVK
jgi:predicted SAM-dependent methyltransferase